MAAEQDALANFDFDKVIPAGKWLKFQADKPITIRVLTTDPLVTNKEFLNKATGEMEPRTQFSFIVYNFTEDRAQILQASPAMSRKFGELHTDEDFGANIRNIDIKITPTGEGLERRYDIQVLPKSRQMTNEQVMQARTIDLEREVENGIRMSQYNPTTKRAVVGSGGAAVGSSGYDKAKAAAANLKREPEAAAEEDDTPPANPDPVVTDFGDEPINLDDIPF